MPRLFLAKEVMVPPFWAGKSLLKSSSSKPANAFSKRGLKVGQEQRATASSMTPTSTSFFQRPSLVLKCLAPWGAEMRAGIEPFT